ncbi:MAG TPA: hypothetical protein VN688_24505 [Gemmataceae bacterium]|nr:hypothetical protein [Gemmataceae bacterium]
MLKHRLGMCKRFLAMLGEQSRSRACHFRCHRSRRSFTLLELTRSGHLLQSMSHP